jgi:UPF0271 protein
LRTASEVFADRGYRPDGSLIPRSQPGAMIADEDSSVRQVLQMVEKGVVTTCDGTEVPIEAGTVCIHGDEPQAACFARKIAAALAQ